MIHFNSQNNFELTHTINITNWIINTIIAESKLLQELNFVFCDDDFLLSINQDFLKHDTFTDIITFDYSVNNLINGEIYISTDRVLENATLFNISFEHELHRVIIHGVLHLCGYKDKTEPEQLLMRSKEDFYLQTLSIQA